MNPSSHPKSARLNSLEPHGSTIVLDDLLRWNLASSQLSFGNRYSSLLTGGRRSTLRGRGIDFDEVRLYQPGDDVRAIDWRVTARASKPHTKVFREEKERPVLLMIDLRSTMFFGSRHTFKSVMASHCAALLAWATLKAGDRIGAMIVSDDGITDIKPRRSRHAILQIFRKLLSIQQTHVQRAQDRSPAVIAPPITAPRLTDVMHQLRSVSKPGTCLILLSDFHDWDDACLQALFPAVRHSQAFGIRISDPLEQQLPDIGTARFRFSQWLQPVDTSDKQFRQRYTQLQKERHTTWKNDWRKLASPIADISTVDPVLTKLRSIFGNGKNARATVYQEASVNALP